MPNLQPLLQFINEHKEGESVDQDFLYGLFIGAVISPAILSPEDMLFTLVGQKRHLLTLWLTDETLSNCWINLIHEIDDCIQKGEFDLFDYLPGLTEFPTLPKSWQSFCQGWLKADALNQDVWMQELTTMDEELELEEDESLVGQYELLFNMMHVFAHWPQYEHDQPDLGLRRQNLQLWHQSIGSLMSKFADVVRRIEEQEQQAALSEEEMVFQDDPLNFGGANLRDFELAKPDDPCPCGSGKPFRKCCLN